MVSARSVRGAHHMQLPVGAHRLVLQHPRRTMTQVVEVRAGAVQELEFNAFASAEGAAGGTPPALNRRSRVHARRRLARLYWLCWTT